MYMYYLELVQHPPLSLVLKVASMLTQTVASVTDIEEGVNLVMYEESCREYRLYTPPLQKIWPKRNT